MTSRSLASLLAAFAAALGFSGATQAQNIVRAIVPFVAGGPSDTGGRIVVQRYNELFPSETVVVENRPGANGQLGARVTAQSAPDGKSWMFADGALLTVNPSLYPRDADFDVDRDLKVIAAVGMQPSLLVVPVSGPKTLKEFVDLAKKQDVTYASAGIGSTGHLTMAYFGSVSKLRLIHVPYKGAQPAMTDLIGGQVQSAFNLIGGSLGFVKSGKVRALAVSGPTRSPDLPDVPTIQESGYPGFDVRSGLFVVIPARTPEDVTRTLEERLQRVVDDPQVHERLRAIGASPAGMTPPEAKKWIAAERERWSKLIRDYNIRQN